MVRKRFFWYSFQGRILFSILLCMTVFFAVTWYMVRYVSRDILLREKGDKLLGYARVLEALFGPGTYDDILRDFGAEDASWEEKLRLLNRELREITEQVAVASPGLGIGFYCWDLDAIVTYGPEAEFGNTIGLPAGPDHPGRTAMAANTAMVRIGSMVRGDIMNAMLPIERNGVVIGYIWANELTTDIEKQFQMISGRMLVILGIIYAASIVLTVLLARRTVRDMNRVIKGVRVLRKDLSRGIEPVKGELGEVVESINAMAADILKADENRRALMLAEAANAAQREFLARMSHEIRTPLNAILGLSEVELRDHLPGRTKLNLEKIYSSGCTLLDIVNDILDISKIEAGNFEIRPVNYDTAGIISDTVQLNIVRVGSKPVEFRLKLTETLPRRLCGDELRIKQILNNLLSNAIKYTEQGEVTLEIDWERQGDTARLRFTVRDTGKGIRQEELGKLFTKYTQLDTMANRKIEGTGLGLSITKGLVEMMGGHIGVESEYGKGSVFEVWLPQEIEDGEPLGEEVAEQLRSFRFYEDRNRRGNIIRYHMPYGKVLVVDDVMMNLDVIKGLMMPYGLQVETAMSGQEAVEKIRGGEPRYDLVFMDHMMPGMDGVQAARIIRQELGTEYARNIPIIALTANAIAGNRELFLNSGFNDFISKPIDIKQLDVALNKWVRDKQSEETLKEAEAETPEEAGKGAGEAAPAEEQGGNDGDGDTGFFERETVKGIDFTAARGLYGESAAVYRRVLKSFAEHTPALLEELADPGGETLAEYAIKVHGLKSSCGAACAAEAAALAEDLERAAKAGDLDFVRLHHGTLEREVRRLIGELSERIGEREREGPAVEKEERPGPDRELLGRLALACSEYRTGEVEKLLGELGKYRYESGGELVRRLKEEADRFEYDGMRDRLERFLAR
jgi:signal transduction histidine kinase/CheY-like chemotaxis protein/HPt (histidine-containing phosphotransfer) domain-containing protein